MRNNAKLSFKFLRQKAKHTLVCLQEGFSVNQCKLSLSTEEGGGGGEWGRSCS